jgi:diguanylate cyclase (GGDEF)-like protein/putative nucleotidyltransferase with HDIG domain
MSDFAFIPIAALCSYLFLSLAFMAAKKTKLINAFLRLLGILILWTGGSFLMRIQLWPSVKFWYDVSLLGLTLLPCGFFYFVSEFIGCKDKLWKNIWPVVLILVNVINISTGSLLAAPEVIAGADGKTAFVYHITWSVAILFGVTGAVLVHLLIRVFRYSHKNNELARRQFRPILIGMVMLFLAHFLLLLPVLEGFPIDILAGLINAIFMFYALYRRRLFRMTLLVSRGSCCAIAAALSMIIFANIIPSLQIFIRNNFPILINYDVLVISLLFTAVTSCIYFAMKRFIDIVFIRDEIAQAETLKEFSLAVSKSLNVNEILEKLVEVISQSIRVQRVYVCIEQEDSGDYIIAQSTSPLDEKSFRLTHDNPLVKWMSEHGECLLMRDFRRTVYFKSMWEEEKKQILSLGIECFVPLKDGETLVGIVLLSAKERNASFTYDDISFLSSLDSVGSIAVKNSRLYEKAVLEAQTDELTGLINRKYFYETLQREYNRTKDKSLALILLSIDDFKLYNQLYGNKEGDVALQKIARIIQASVGTNGYVARYSGKEFAIILPLYDTLAAKTLAETIRIQIYNMNKRASDYALKVLTVSGGVCSIPVAAANIRQLVENADMAMYQVKRNGKNAIMVYSVGIDSQRKQAEEENEKDKASIYSGYASTIYALTAAIDVKDHYTFSHSKNVAYYATELGFACGLNSDSVEIIREAALLHDIGKIGIPEQILNKPGMLTQEEYEIIKSHVEQSVGIIRHLPSLDYVIPAVIGHHERYDGKGYPRRISGEDIPLSARILCIADSFDAMISKRSYKAPYSLACALQEIEDKSGRQFDPKLAHLFVDLVRNGTIKPVKSDEEIISNN